MLDSNALKVKRVTDIKDQVMQKKVMYDLLAHITASMNKFNEAYQQRRNTLLEINAIYRNQSYLDKNRTEWQTKSFIPISYDAVERKTSVVHQALWGNRMAAPFSVIGRTYEDHSFAFSAETLLNNVVDRVGFYGTSEECLRSTCKNGLGVYRYGWLRRGEEQLYRQTKRDKDGKVLRDEENNPVYEYVNKTRRISEPFIRSIDIVDHIGWDPTAKQFDKWLCDFVYEVREETPEQIWDKEQAGEYDDNSFDNLTKIDPHGIDSVVYNATGDKKEPQIRRDEGVLDSGFYNIKPRYGVVEWFGWFDIDGDKKREFIQVICVPERKIILAAYENILNEYPYVDIQFSRSLHSLTPWGVVDPVIGLQYEVNELHNQRGDGIKLKLNPQFLINTNRILEDHSYISQPGALHPFAMEGNESVSDAMVPLQFQNLESISVAEEEGIISKFSQVTGVADLNKVLGSSNKDTPATTVVSILNEQQAGNSMIVNGILERHGLLGSRILKLLQLFGDEKFIIRSAGHEGLVFRNESMENILGDYDVKVTTSTFFGNRQIELQYLIQMMPMWAQDPSIDRVELNRAILENILPKRVDNILKAPREPLSALDEQLIFMVGKGVGLKINPQESLIDINSKLRAHQIFLRSDYFKKMDGESQYLFKDYFQKLTEQAQQLQQVQMLQAQQAAKVQGQVQEGMQGPDGNATNTGSPAVRSMGNSMRPTPNNIQGM
jgi:hypothetical protein